MRTVDWPDEALLGFIKEWASAQDAARRDPQSYQSIRKKRDKNNPSPVDRFFAAEKELINISVSGDSPISIAIRNYQKAKAIARGNTELLLQRGVDHTAVCAERMDNLHICEEALVKLAGIEVITANDAIEAMFPKLKAKE